MYQHNEENTTHSLKVVRFIFFMAALCGLLLVPYFAQSVQGAAQVQRNDNPGGPPGGPGGLRRPAPSALAQRESERTIRETFQTQLKEAEKEVKTEAELQARRQACRNLVQQLEKESSDADLKPATRFVLLRDCVDLSARALDLSRALEHVSRLEQSWAIDPLEWRLRVFTKATSEARQSAEYQTIAEATLSLVEAPSLRDNLAAVAKILELGRAAAEKSNNAKLVERLQQRLQAIEGQLAEWNQVQKALETLKQNSEDAEANLIVGRYTALVKQDWNTALPLLSKGSEPLLRLLSRLELSGTVSERGVRILADSWWEAASKEDGSRRSALRRRAAQLYANMILGYQHRAQFGGRRFSSEDGRAYKWAAKRLQEEADLPPLPASFQDTTPRLLVLWQKGDEKEIPTTQRFGLTLPGVKAPAGKKTESGLKQLTYHPQGVTNNTCIRLDGKEWLLGQGPGKWLVLETPLEKEGSGHPRHGKKSLWEFTDTKVAITQSVEVVRGQQTGLLDTCRVTYLLENRDSKPHTVGLRFLLDTLVGAEDGAPFIVPAHGQKGSVIDTSADFRGQSGIIVLSEPQMIRKNIPAFAYALENPSLANPGVVAELGLRVGEGPTRFTLGGWPDKQAEIAGAAGPATLWEVPVFSSKKLGDSAAVLYWDAEPLAPNQRREMGFTYGLSQLTSSPKGELGMLLQGPALDGLPLEGYGGHLFMTALVDARVPHEVTLHLPPGVEWGGGDLLPGRGFNKVKVDRATDTPGNLSVALFPLRVRQPGVYNFVLEREDGVRIVQSARIGVNIPPPPPVFVEKDDKK